MTVIILSTSTKVLIEFAILSQWWLSPTWIVNDAVVARVDVQTLIVLIEYHQCYFNTPDGYNFYDVVQADIRNKIEGQWLNAPTEERMIYWPVFYDGHLWEIPIGRDIREVE